MTIQASAILQQLIERHDLSFEQMQDLMRAMLAGEVSSLMVGTILTALRVKRETIDELHAAVLVLREFMVRVDTGDSTHLVDLVGTGGDGAHTFNISTAAALVAAAAGARVAKHGNRSVSSKCGSADVLEAFGVNVQQTPQAVAACLNTVGIGFMLTPHHQPAMKPLMSVRKEMGVRTLFNMVGPLTNPAGAPNQLIGVFDPALTGVHAEILRRFGARHAMVVHGSDGLDEITLGGSTRVVELREGAISEYEIHPAQFGMACARVDCLRVDGVDASQKMLLQVLYGQTGPALDVVLLNAAAALYCAGVATDLQDGVERARAAIGSGAARACLDKFVGFRFNAAA